MNLEWIAPVVLTCARKIEYVETFVNSWRKQRLHTLRPIVVVDVTCHSTLPPDYLDLIIALDPRIVCVHSRPAGLSDGDSIQDAAFFCLDQALRHRRSEETHVLFVEDDVVFSSQIQDGLDSAVRDPEVAFQTFYEPHDGYGEEGHHVVARETIQGGHFYGTQCLLLPNKSVRLIVENRTEIERQYPPGYDLRWSRFLTDQGRIAYGVSPSLVQHIGIESRIGCMGHRSNTFVG